MTKVLFVCVGNSCRSQMAEGFFRYYCSAGDEVASAGTAPTDSVSALAVEVMGERGVDISGHRPKALTWEMLENADVVVSMGCGVSESCPLSLGDDVIDWDIEDPHDQGIGRYREVRDEIERKVRELLDDSDR